MFMNTALQTLKVYDNGKKKEKKKTNKQTNKKLQTGKRMNSLPHRGKSKIKQVIEKASEPGGGGIESLYLEIPIINVFYPYSIV